MVRANQLISLGVHPTIVHGLLSDTISLAKAKDLYRSVHNASPKPGLKPTGIDWWARYEDRRLHSSVLVARAARFRKFYQHPADVFFHAYVAYQQWATQKALLDPDRAFYLLHSLTTRRIMLVTCQCSALSIVEAGTRADQTRCPICALGSRRKRAPSAPSSLK